MARQKKVENDAECLMIIRALTTDARFNTMAEFQLGGVTYARKDLILLFQSVLDASAKSVSTRAAWTVAVRNERTLRARVRAVRNALRIQVESRFGPTEGALRVLGFKVTARQKPTVEVVRAAVAKRLATRAARHTLGKKQKKKIKGKV
jgi:hypothetical protein